MNNQEKLTAVKDAYTIKMSGADEIAILRDEVSKEVGQKLIDIAYDLDTTLDIAHDIMKTACDIIGDKFIVSDDRDNTRDNLNGDDCDFYADADSCANVYTGVQLSYLTIGNEAEISGIVKDESITSIAIACSAWHTQKVVDACEAIKAWIME